jgi:hypothetical protein
LASSIAKPQCFPASPGTAGSEYHSDGTSIVLFGGFRMREPDKKNIIKIDPGTLLLIVSLLILLPLLMTGFLGQ